MIYKLAGAEVNIYSPMTIGAVNYPANYFTSPENRAQVGMTEEADPLPPPLSPTEVLEAAKNRAIMLADQYLQQTCTSHGYDNIVSACSYAGAPNTFQEESIKFIVFRGTVWDSCISLLNDVIAGTKPIPTDEEFLAMLPVFA